MKIIIIVEVKDEGGAPSTPVINVFKDQKDAVDHMKTFYGLEPKEFLSLPGAPLKTEEFYYDEDDDAWKNIGNETCGHEEIVIYEEKDI